MPYITSTFAISHGFIIGVQAHAPRANRGEACINASRYSTLSIYDGRLRVILPIYSEKKCPQFHALGGRPIFLYRISYIESLLYIRSISVLSSIATCTRTRQVPQEKLKWLEVGFFTPHFLLIPAVNRKSNWGVSAAVMLIAIAHGAWS